MLSAPASVVQGTLVVIGAVVLAAEEENVSPLVMIGMLLNLANEENSCRLLVVFSRCLTPKKAGDLTFWRRGSELTARKAVNV